MNVYRDMQIPCLLWSFLTFRKNSPLEQYLLMLCMSRLVSPWVNKAIAGSWDGGQPCSSSSHARHTSKSLKSRSRLSLNQYIFLCSKLELDIALFPINFQTFRTRRNHLKVFSNLFKGHRTESTDRRNSYLYFYSLIPWDSNSMSWGYPYYISCLFLLLLEIRGWIWGLHCQGSFCPRNTLHAHLYIYSC